MKRTAVHIIFLICLPVGVWSQVNPIERGHRFYAELAHADAMYEHTLPKMAIEDEIDFWTDQKTFERHLAENDPQAYQIYLNSKGSAYRAHQKICGTHCGHGEQYFRTASFYMVNGEAEDVMAYTAEPKEPKGKN